MRSANRFAWKPFIGAAVFFTIWAIGAKAQVPAGKVHHRIIGGIASNAGGTVKNMFTFQHKIEAVTEWWSLVAGGLDAYSTRQVEHFCIGCQDEGILGSHPSAKLAYSADIGAGFIAAMLVHAHAEHNRGNFWELFSPAIGATLSIPQLYAAIHNTNIAREWKRCFDDPVCAAKYVGRRNLYAR